MHSQGEACPATGKMCTLCNRPGHFKKVCRTADEKRLKPGEWDAQPRSQTTQPHKKSWKGGATGKSAAGANSILMFNDPVINAVSRLNRVERSECPRHIARVGNRDVEFLVDTGASVSLLPAGLYVEATGDAKFRQLEHKPEDHVVAYNGQRMELLGSVKTTLRSSAGDTPIIFYILHEAQAPVIGARDAAAMKLVSYGKDTIAPTPTIRQDRQTLSSDSIVRQRRQTVSSDVVNAVDVRELKSAEDLAKVYPKVFCEGPGDLKIEHVIQVDPNIVPVQHSNRRVPEPIREAVEAELAKMEAADIIAPVTEPTPWISSMVIVPKKNGDVRICLDPRDLNKAIKREIFQMPTAEEVFARLEGAKMFTVADVAKGFWHIRLHPSTAKMTTFKTHKGRYYWKRLPFGLNSSPEVFQKHLITALEGLPDVYVCADDILIVGRGDTAAEVRTTHDHALQGLLERCTERGIVLNAAKLQLRLESITYMGHVITKDGLKADPEKVSAIMDMPAPDDVSKLRGFLATVNYLAKFLPDLSTTAEPMRRLLKQDMDFVWSSAQQEAFEEIKRKCCSTQYTVLQYYNVRKPIVLQTDASQYGVGAAIIQDGKPVAYASRAMTSAERNYAQIEKELLAVVVAVKKFDCFLFGHADITVHTDHKPLVPIHQRPIVDAPNRRIERMLLKLQRYNLKFIWVPGKELWIADTLSRQIPIVRHESQTPSDSLVRHDRQTPSDSLVRHYRQTLSSDDMGTPLEKHISTIEFTHELDERRADDVRDATDADPVLPLVRNAISTGNWTSTSIAAYSPVRNELFQRGGIVYKNNRLIVPMSMRHEVLGQLHAAHQGIEATNRRARDTVYWPGITEDIKRKCTSCESCLAYADSQPREPMQSHELPEGPWQRVGMDFFELKKQQYLLMTDYWSNWPELIPLSNITAAALIIKCKEKFAIHGIPRVIVADSGTQFTSRDFQQFAKIWKFDIELSSPHYHQSNGKAEQAVGNIKRILKRCAVNGDDAYLALLAFRNTPSAATGSSPSQKIFGRRTRTTLPLQAQELNPEIPQETQDKLVQSRNEAARLYDRGKRQLPQMTSGQEIVVQVPGTDRWIPGTVARPLANRKYEVHTQDGGTYVRNRVQLRPSPRRSSDNTVRQSRQTLSSGKIRPRHAVNR